MLTTARPEPGVSNQICVFHMGGREPALSNHLSPSGTHVSRQLDWGQRTCDGGGPGSIFTVKHPPLNTYKPCLFIYFF